MLKYSFIICTLNRPSELKNAIESILNQNYDNLEIIVVDQSEKENRSIANIDKRVKYFHSNIKGLSKNRNIGIAYATGDYVCIMDDDATYGNKSLENIDKLIRETNSEMVGGVILDPLSNEYYVSGSENYKEGYISESQVFSCCSSAALVISRKLALNIKFDENLGAGERWGSAEEIDFILRSLYKNNRFYFTPKFIVYHPAADKRTAGIKKTYSYSLGYGALCAKHFFTYHNKKIVRRYKIAIFKHIVAFVLFSLKRDKYLKEFYITSIKGKREGFKEYKNSKI